MSYKLIKNSKGDRWMGDGKFVKASDVPESEKSRVGRSCVFCGAPGTEEKTLNSLTHYLCLDDYNSKTTGELASTIALSKVAVEN